MCGSAGDWSQAHAPRIAARIASAGTRHKDINLILSSNKGENTTNKVMNTHTHPLISRQIRCEPNGPGQASTRSQGPDPDALRRRPCVCAGHTLPEHIVRDPEERGNLDGRILSRRDQLRPSRWELQVSMRTGKSVFMYEENSNDHALDKYLRETKYCLAIRRAFSFFLGATP